MFYVVNSPSISPRWNKKKSIEDESDFDGIDFPVTADKSASLERSRTKSQSSSLVLKTYYLQFTYQNKVLPPPPPHVNLLLYSKINTRHYSLIKDLNKLLNYQNQKKSRMYYCRYFLHRFI